MSKSTAIILAAGYGKRMNSKTPKQYMLISGKPVLYYSLQAFELSNIDDIVLVVGESEISEVYEEIVEKYRFHKVRKVVAGGLERYLSVLCGLKQIEDTDFVLIHDGARPMISVDVINEVISKVMIYRACIVGVPSKDTVKIADKDDMVALTPDRSDVWLVQTPQAFAYDLLLNAYMKLMEDGESNVTDDSMVVERTGQCKVQLVLGTYENIKITTMNDLKIAELFLREET